MELVRRKIHGDEGLSGLRVRRYPTTRLLNGFVESEKSKVQDKITLLGDRDEDVGNESSWHPSDSYSRPVASCWPFPRNLCCNCEEDEHRKRVLELQLVEDHRVSHLFLIPTEIQAAEKSPVTNPHEAFTLR